MYRNLKELTDGIMSCVNRCPFPEKDGDAQAWYADDPESARVTRLVNIYFDALQNPPEGVVGAGAISYAEQKLVEAQNGS
jgi:hypothetical protein